MPAHPPAFDPRNAALFLDLDGTLLEIAARPDLVEMSPDLRADIKSLVIATNGCTTIVSGRSLNDLDRILEPLSLPAAGSHGAEMRWDAGGEVTSRRWTVPEWLISKTEDVLRVHPELLVERKPASIAVHYRAKPKAEKRVQELLTSACEQLGADFSLLAGKMVFELRESGCNKGSAIEHFMQLPRMLGRMPVFVGDDVTDEDGFAVVNALGGYSVKVGDTDSTSAQFRLNNVACVHAWLRSLVYTERRASL